jgi:O-antigen ligase
MSKWLWAAALISVPLAYNPISKWQYEPDKTALILVWAGLLAGMALWRGDVPRLAAPRVERWLVGYLGVRWLATAHSILPHWSLWGEPAWGNGLWLLLAGVLIFGLARRQFVTAPQQQWVVHAILLGSLPVAGYGVLQYAGGDVLGLDEGRTIGRVASTLAHPNLLAAYLAVVLPLAAWRLVEGPGRVGAAGLLIVLGVCLVFTYSRAGWLASMAGLVVFGLARLWIADRRRLTALLAAGMALGGIALLVLSLLPPLPSDAPHVLQTLTSLFRRKGATVQIRLHAWAASLDAIQDRPLLGYGPATFEPVLAWHLPPELAPFGRTAALGGRAHNVYLAVAVESGLLGLAAYLGLLAALLGPVVVGFFTPPPGPLTTRREGESGREKVPSPFTEGLNQSLSLRAAILGGLVAHLVNNLFSFESAAGVLLFWTLAGMAHARPGPVHAPRIPRCRLGSVLLAGGALLLAAFMVVPGMFAYQGETSQDPAAWSSTAIWLECAAAWSPVPEEFRLALGWRWAGAAQHGDPALWARGAAVHDALAADYPAIVAYRERQALHYRRWYSVTRRPELAAQAVAAYDAALARSPRDPDLWLDRGLLRLDMGDAAGALTDIQQADALLPDYARTYGALAVYALAQGDAEAAAHWQARQDAARQTWDDWVWRR